MNELIDHPLFAESAPGRALARRPLGFVDVGARGGVHPLVEPVARGTAVLGFEPDAEECRRILSEAAGGTGFARLELEPTALAERDGEAELHLLSVATNHSLLPPNQGYVERYDMVKWREVGRTRLATTTLDAVLYGARAAEDSWGEVLKLDTQGTEYEILRGAARTLDERCLAVVTEVSFCELYRGQKLFSEVETLLRAHGFAFYGFDAPHHRSCRRLDKRESWGRERLIQADAVFFKDPLGGGPAAGTTLDERALAVLFTLALLLGFHDFALELAAHAWPGGADARRLEALVRERAALPAEQATAAAQALAARAAAAPGLANLEVGRFVDARRHLNDYADVPERSENDRDHRGQTQ